MSAMIIIGAIITVVTTALVVSEDSSEVAGVEEDHGQGHLLERRVAWG